MILLQYKQKLFHYQYTRAWKSGFMPFSETLIHWDLVCHSIFYANDAIPFSYADNVPPPHKKKVSVFSSQF